MKQKLKRKLKNRKFMVRFLLIAVVVLALVSLSLYKLVIEPLQSADTYVYKEVTEFDAYKNYNMAKNMPKELIRKKTK